MRYTEGMSIITNTDLAAYLGTTFSAAEQVQADYAIDQATAILSGLLCFNVDPAPINTAAIPPALQPIGAGTCGTIVAGKFKAFALADLRRFIVEPFTGSVRQVVIVPSGVDFAGKNTCTAGLTFVKAFQYEESFNGDVNRGYFNRLDVCAGCCKLESDCLPCHRVYVDADWGWGTDNAALPSAIKSAALEIAKDVMAQAGNEGLKSENVDGHSYTYEGMPDYNTKFAMLRKTYGACGSNIL